MPLYDFIDDATGETQDFYFPMGEAPCGIGDTMEADGRTWRRLPPNVQRPLAEEDCYHVSSQHPPFWKAHKDMGGAFTKDGKTVMTSYSQIEKTLGQANDVYGEKVVYDGPRRKIGSNE